MRGIFQGRKCQRQTLWFGGACLLVVVICYQGRNQYTEVFLEQVADVAELPLEDIGSVDIHLKGQLTLRDIDLGKLGKIDFLEILWDWSELLQRRVDQVRLHGVQLVSSKLQQLQQDRSGTEAKNEEPAEMKPFTLGKLIIGQAVLILDDLGTGLPPIPIRLGEVTPLVFDNLYLGGANNDPAAMIPQRVEVNDLVLYSPYDPLAKVLEFERISLVFSWAGIQQRQIEQFVIEKPVIYAGEELFWFVDQIQKLEKKEQVVKKDQTLPWTIGDFRLIGGKLVVTALGNPGFTLPVVYEFEQQGLVLDDFANAPLKMALTIPRTNLNYPEYGVRVSNLRGTLEFSLPAGKQTVDNLVNTIHMDSISWKGVTATNAWTSVTLDQNGIYCDLGAETYGGYTEGKLSILVNEGMRWIAGAYVTNTEVSPIAEKLAPEYIKINGGVTSSLDVEGAEKLITKAEGSVNWQEPGRMEVIAVDDLLEKLPVDWIPAKKDAASIALKAFRDYDYDNGRCQFSYGPPESSIDLKFEGEQGKRDFVIQWNDLRDNPRFGW